eukprot:GHVU01221792.1.p1 GENE.GHVU01221792.1~~GHVU01221792.1.p1  ORF type:complete len:874 (+),score=92.83 GHVU01221792.1:158-2779(+)
MTDHGAGRASSTASSSATAAAAAAPITSTCENRRSAEWRHFDDLGPVEGTMYYWARCKYCYAQASGLPVGGPQPIQGRARSLRNHLAQCVHYRNSVGSVESHAEGRIAGTSTVVEDGGGAAAASNSAAPVGPPSRNGGAAVASTAAPPSRNDGAAVASAAARARVPGRQQTLVGWLDRALTAADTMRLHRLCLEATAVSNLPFTFWQSPTTRAVIEHIRPAAVEALPTRKALAGPALERRAVEDRDAKLPTIRQTVEQGSTLFVKVDTWKTGAGTGLVGVTTGCLQVSFAVTEALGNAGNVSTEEAFHGIAVARQVEEIMNHVQELVGHEPTGLCSDEAGQLSRGKRILSKRFPHRYFAKCYAHQFHRMAQDLYNKSGMSVVMAACHAMVLMLRDNIVWSNKLRNKQMEVYGRHAAMFKVSHNRWGTIQACTASCLRSRTAIEFVLLDASSKCNVTPAKTRPPPSLLRVFDMGPAFWAKVETAGLLMQREENTLADVLYMYGRIVSGLAGRGRPYVEPVEARFLKEEQPVFILAGVLCPRRWRDFCRRLRTADIINAADLTYMVIFYYKKFVGDDYTGIEGAFTKWYDGVVDEAELISPESLWQVISRGSDPGAQKLARLALKILSFPVQSASVERLFSDFGQILTKTRNRLGAAKVHHLANIKADMRGRQQPHVDAAGTLRKRLVNPAELPRAADTLELRHGRRGDCDSSRDTESVQYDEFDVGEAIPQAAVDDDTGDEDECGVGRGPNGVLGVQRGLEVSVGGELLVGDGAGESDDDEADEDGAADGSVISLAREVIEYSHDTGEQHRSSYPYPEVNVKNFPQDKPTRGLRVRKFPLLSLFPVDNPVLDMLLQVDMDPAPDAAPGRRLGDL